MSQVVNYRHGLLESIRKRNSIENEPFSKLIKSHAKLTDLTAHLRSELAEIKHVHQKLQHDNLDLLKSPGANSSTPPERLRQLDEQLLRAKGDVIDLQKKLIDQSDQVIALNKQIKEKDDELATHSAKHAELEKQLENLRLVNRDLENRFILYDEQIKLWKDEKVECEVQYNCLVQKYDKLKEDYQAILTASLRFREEQIEKVNKLNELENERIQAKLKEELEKASQPTQDFLNITSGNFVSVGPANVQQNQVVNFKAQLNVMPLVSKPICKFDCHEGEVNAIKYHKSGKYFATGGGDRKIKLWEFKDGKCELISNLIGSNASIASIDIDNENNLIAGTSFDFACRLWSLNEHRLRMSSGDLQPTHTLTGHTNKVLAGKFLGVMKVVTGSYDRTLKIWDLMQKACIKTLFAGSSCNDLVTLDSQTIISGHIDKKIRFWDTRSDPAQTEILLQGKITALDISSNKNYLLASIRDVNTLKLIDIRMNQVTETYCSDDFKIGYDWSRAIFSPDVDHQYVSAGSADGSVIIWNTLTARVEKVLKEHSSSVISMCWHPQGTHLISTDAKKKAIIWSS